MRRLLSVCLLLLVTGCPEGVPKGSSGPGPCRKFGDNCEFAPGKLGSCVVRDGCTGNDCFVCQSQH